MKAERCRPAHVDDAARLQVGRGQRAGDRLGHGEQPSRGFRGSGRDRGGVWLRSQQTEKAPRLVQRVAERARALHGGDQVEQVAVLAGRRVGPLAGGARAGAGAMQADVEAAPRRVADVAGEPVAALAASVGQVVAADRLGVLGKAARQVGYRVRHRGLRTEQGPPHRGPHEACFVGWSKPASPRGRRGQETGGVTRRRPANPARVDRHRGVPPRSEAAQPPAARCPVRRYPSQGRTSALACAAARAVSRTRPAASRLAQPSRPSSGGRCARPPPRPGPPARLAGCAPW